METIAVGNNKDYRIRAGTASEDVPFDRPSARSFLGSSAAFSWNLASSYAASSHTSFSRNHYILVGRFERHRVWRAAANQVLAGFPLFLEVQGRSRTREVPARRCCRRPRKQRAATIAEESVPAYLPWYAISSDQSSSSVNLLQHSSPMLITVITH